MAVNFNPLQVRAVLGRKQWGPPRIHGGVGSDSWMYDHVDHVRGSTIGRVIVSQSVVRPDPADAQRLRYDATEWIHASMSWIDRTPTWDELQLLKRAVWGDAGEAYQVHPPTSEHINIHAFALHLWGRADGKRVLPNFGALGTI